MCQSLAMDTHSLICGSVKRLLYWVIFIPCPLAVDAFVIFVTCNFPG